MNRKMLSFIGLFAIIVLCLFRYVFFSYYTAHADEMKNKCLDHVSGVAFNTLADSLEYVATKIELFELVDLDENLENIPKREIVSQLSRFKNSFYYVSSVYLALENGQYYESSTVGGEMMETENQKWYYETRKNLKTNFITATKSNKTNCAIISSPFYYNGEYVGVIAAEIDNALFKKTAEYFDDELSQLIISDKNNNPLFVYDKSFKEDDKYMKYESSYSFMIHNTKNIAKYNVTLYTLKTGNSRPFIISTWLFSGLFVMIIIITIWVKWLNNKEITIGLFGLQIVVIMTLEIITSFVLFEKYYHDYVGHHNTIAEKYVEQSDASAKYISETIWEKIQDKKIFKTNALLATDSKEMHDIIELFKKTQENNSHVTNFFFISKDGEYQNYPYNPSYTAKDFNYQINRRLLNGSDRSTYVASVDMSTWMLKEYVFKVKDDRNNYIGTFGINLKFNIPEDMLARYFSNNVVDKYIEYKDGIVSSIDKEGNWVIEDDTLTDKQIDEINQNQFGIIKVKQGYLANHYLYFETLRGNTKRIIPIDIGHEDVRVLLLICVIASTVGAFLSFFLSVKERKNEITYENVEENYEVELMKNEEKFFETLRDEEDIEKGIKIMRTFGKKPSEKFKERLKKYLEKKNDNEKYDI